MSLPDINFERIRSYDNSQNSGFEEICAQLAELEHQEPGSEFFRKGRGSDAGVECFLRLADQSERGWQAKYLFTWDNSLVQQLDKSIDTALTKHQNLVEYIVCLPFDLSDSKPTKGQSALDKWLAWKKRWESYAANAGRSLDVRLWSKSTLVGKLTRDDARYSGRLIYWFGTQSLTRDWFEHQFEKARAGLGSRYSPESNVELPIRQKFLSFVRDPQFPKTLLQWSNRLREDRSSTRNAMKDIATSEDREPFVKPLESALASLIGSLEASPTRLGVQMPLLVWSQCTAQCLKLASAALNWTYDLPPGEVGSKGIEPPRWARSCLRRLLDILREIENALNSDVWIAANHQILLLEGSAGIGKSHLLGDIVEHQILRGRPALLILGSSLVEAEPWRQIMTGLDLPSSQQVGQFLGSLDASAQAAGVRALICIDALNERNGLDIWPNHLATFLKTIEPFRNVCVALSCRSTFTEHILPSDFNADGILRIVHSGFGGDSDASAKAYLSKRGIVRPGAPNLAPEFQNPLFLKTCCDSLERDGKRELPKGLRGVTAIFGFYNESVAKQLTRRMKLAPIHGIIPAAINGFAELQLEAKPNHVALDKAIEFFESILPSNGSLDRSLLTQLESEGVISVELVQEDQSLPRKMVRFTFERFSDHACALRLLDEHVINDDVKAAFSEGSFLHDLVFGPKSHLHAGVIEALAIQLPERYSVELVDVNPPTRKVIRAFEESLLWRDQACFSDRTFDLVNEYFDHRVDDILLSIATEPSNKFNARHLDGLLKNLTMPERDKSWSRIVAAEGDVNGGAIETLITWGFENGAEAIEDERSELAAITLIWLLTTASRWVRDRATKSLASIFANRLGLAELMLRQFSDVDDLYLVERLYAAVYGAVLQGCATSGLADLSKTVFDLIFATGTPPINILVRDNAYGIIKYAQTCGCLPASVTASHFEPPYRSPWPPEHVPDRIIGSYTMDYGKGQRFHDDIVGSTVNDGDFARYVVDYRVDDWSPAPIGATVLPTNKDVFDAWLERFRKTANEKQMAALNDVLAAARAAKGKTNYSGKPDAVDISNDQFKVLMDSHQWEEYRVQAKDFIRHQLFADWGHKSKAKFNTGWARRWICKRAHDLGWTAARFGQIDRNHSGDRYDHRVERIGKKYQWLALYELAAMMSDNLAFLGGYRDFEEGEHRGFGNARELRLREIDPSLLVTKTNYDGWPKWEQTWWVPKEPRLASVKAIDQIAWLHDEADILNDASLIELLDPKTKKRWLCLHSFGSYTQSGFVDDRSTTERETWFRLHCIVVKKADEKKLVISLSNKRFTQPHSLPYVDLHGEFHLGEYPWHPAVSEFGDWATLENIEPAKIMARATVADYTCERAGYDYSLDKTVSVQLPTPWMAKALGIRLSNGRTLNYTDSEGNVVFYDPSVVAQGHQAALVDRTAFLEMLDREGLAAVWVISGEKNVYGGDRAFGGRVSHTAVYHFEGENLRRLIHSTTEHPSQKQLESLFDPEPVPLSLLEKLANVQEAS